MDKGVDFRPAVTELSNIAHDCAASRGWAFAQSVTSWRSVFLIMTGLFGSRTPTEMEDAEAADGDDGTNKVEREIAAIHAAGCTECDTARLYRVMARVFA